MSATETADRGEQTSELPLWAQVARRREFGLSTRLLVAAATLVVMSSFLPYWSMELEAPQYPRGLGLTLYVDHIVGDIREIDGLNHYIGMAPLGSAAELERQLAPLALISFTLMIAAVAFVHTKWLAPLVLPALLFPAVFLADLFYWLRAFGHGLDPRAPLSGAIKPFTPTLLGRGEIGQFATVARLEPGFWLALTASAMIVMALVLRLIAERAVRRALGGGAP